MNVRDLVEQLQSGNEVQALVAQNLKLEKKVKTLERKVNDQGKESKYQKQKITFLSEQLKLLQLQFEKLD